MTVLLTALGVALNLLVLRDIFFTLFVPTRTGALSSLLARYIWRIFRHLERRRSMTLALAGPVALLCIIVLWAVALAVGWAVIFWPRLPSGFHFSTGTGQGDEGGFVDALYLSLVTLGTLGYGDIVPQSAWLRLVVPLEALIGFALGTASVSWILSIAPVLAHRRDLARGVFLLHRAERRGGVALGTAESGALVAVLQRLTEQVTSMRNDLAQVPITYYFHTPDRGSAIEVALLDLASLARAAGDHAEPAVRFHAVLLREALADLATHVAETFLDMEPGPTEVLLGAYAADHAHPVDRQSREREVRDDLHAER